MKKRVHLLLENSTLLSGTCFVTIVSENRNTYFYPDTFNVMNIMIKDIQEIH